MTGFEYSAAVLMLYEGMLREGVVLIANIRRRYDGERRNPWNEAECGHHYARAMASWSALLALGGFRYHASERSLEALPQIAAENFRSPWFTATGWGVLEQKVAAAEAQFSLRVRGGTLALHTVSLAARGNSSSARLGVSKLPHQFRNGRFSFGEQITLREGDLLELSQFAKARMAPSA